MNDNFNPEYSLDYMFDIPEKWKIHQVMLSTKNIKFNEIRNTFYNLDLSSLEDFSVITNVHAYYKLGTYIVHNVFVEEPFLRSDDFDFEFSIKEYNISKKIKKLTEKYDYFEQLDKFRDDKYIKTYIIKDEYLEEFNLKTKWNIVTKNNKPIALISDSDSNRLLYINNYEYKKIKMKNLEEGVDFIKTFK